jgi:hypothetical protein
MKRKSAKFTHNITFLVSDLLKKSTSKAKRKALDIADYLERFILKKYLKGELRNSGFINHLKIENGLLVNEMNNPANWDLSGKYTN